MGIWLLVVHAHAIHNSILDLTQEHINDIKGLVRRNQKDISGRIVTIEYDPNRNAYICLIHYGDGEKRYILHPRGAIIGDTIVSGTKVPISMGNALPLSAV
ncbi:hypothetical protein SEVIR_7G004105v4 [Setaria viridis]|uniref:Large ribosomal subunit protein uL2 RNA-binding domain-containing protein n=1 Tax=Setaria viridis TaxID=4556 RepID=A0A4U6TR47_SETVI|nr:hypothetical protein SEVIR_7G004105v2 [Setaria viridis]